MSETSAVCGVCGGVLDDLVVRCGRCRTPSHSDCWTYNSGCAVYGCGGAETLANTVVATDAPAPTPGPETSPMGRLVAGAVGVSSGFALLHWLLPAPWGALLGIGLVTAAWRWHLGQQAARDAAAYLPPPDDREQLRLETKAVLALMGQGETADLAQAYALFEQRRPRARLPGEQQVALGLELAQGGYRVLAAEALEKTFRHDPAGAPEAVRAAYRALFADTPAFAAEALGLVPGEAIGLVPAEVLSHPPGGAPPTRLDLRGLLEPHPQYLLALSPRGFPPQWQRSYWLPTQGEGDDPERCAWVAGPLGPAERDARLDELRDLGEEALPVLAEEVALPRVVEEVTRLSLTSKGASFDTPDESFSFPWDEVVAVHFERFVRTEVQRKVETTTTYGARGARASHVTTREVREDHHDSVLEVHVGEPLRRLRVRTNHPQLFSYLGRRRELSFETNLRYAAKDLVRFAPGAQASRGLVAMLSERPASEPGVVSAREFEERVLWFTGLHAPRVRRWWAEQVRARG